MTARFIVGGALEVLAGLPAGSVDLVFTSPPFLALRSYLPADHPDKDKEIGAESTPGEFIDALLDVVEACGKVLAPHGTICFELGDTYAGSGGAGGDYGPDGLKAGRPVFEGSAAKHRSIPKSRDKLAPDAAPPPRLRTRRQLVGWPLDKSLCLIPEMFRFALVYGFNPLTGRETEPWRARNVVRWCKPNPTPGALGDKVRPATSDIVIACRGRSRYFDLDAVRHENPRAEEASRTRAQMNRGSGGYHTAGSEENAAQNPNGAPPLDHWWEDEDLLEQDAWLLPTSPYQGSHYATFPKSIVIKPILAMSPERVCRICGIPSTRIVESQRVRTADGLVDPPKMGPTRIEAGGSVAVGVRNGIETNYTTVGWTDCGHDDWRPGLVLDPFGGSGTVAAVASGHGRDSISIDIDERNAELARDRVGMFLQVEYPEATGCA